MYNLVINIAKKYKRIDDVIKSTPNGVLFTL